MVEPSPFWRRGLLCAGIPLCLLILLRGESPAQVQTKDQQACSLLMNVSLERVASTLGDDVSACIKASAQGKLAGTVDDCITADLKDKVAKASAKTFADFGKKCDGPSLPPFGVTSPANVNGAARDKELDLFHDLFGPSLDAALIAEATDKGASKCQQAIARELKQCQDVKLARFGRCVKAGLKDKATPFTSAAALAACIGDDPDGAVAKQCDLREEVAPGKLKVDAIRKSLAQECVDQGVDLAAAFSSCGSNDPEAVHACVDRAVECRVCLALARAAALDRDCDQFDDGLANGSCVPGPLVIGQQQCVLDPLVSTIRIRTSGFDQHLDLSGIVDLDCGAVDPLTDEAACACAVESLDPVAVPPLGFLCITPAPGCPVGTIDCDGGDGLDASITSTHDLGGCSGNPDCASQCTDHCAASGAAVLESGCEGFCRGGPNEGLVCVDDSLCPGGACIGPDGVVHSNICQCQCIGGGGAASRRGGLRCNVGVDVTFERNPPCGGGDVLLDLGRQCIPLTTEGIKAVIVGANDVPMTELPPGGTSLRGLPLTCPTLASDNTTGLGLVSAENAFDAPGAGDIAFTFSMDCL